MAAIEKIRRKAVVLAAASAAATLALLLLLSTQGPSFAAPPREDVAALYNALPTETARRLYFAQSEGLTKPVDPRLVALDQLAIACISPGTIRSMPDDSPNRGGQCCGVLMSVHHYQEQLDALRAEFGTNLAVPPDPYNISVPVAKKWIRYNDEVKLSPVQQKAFDDAMAMSVEKPCCCKCWKYYVYEGLGKYLLVNGMTPQQVARLWDLSDACGGPKEHAGAVHGGGA